MQKTLPHALSRAAASGAVEVGPGRLANVLKTYAVTQDKVGTARTRMDEEIRYVVVSLGSFLAGERASAKIRNWASSLRSSVRRMKYPAHVPQRERATIAGGSKHTTSSC